MEPSTSGKVWHCDGCDEDFDESRLWWSHDFASGLNYPRHVDCKGKRLPNMSGPMRIGAVVVPAFQAAMTPPGPRETFTLRKLIES